MKVHCRSNPPAAVLMRCKHRPKPGCGLKTFFEIVSSGNAVEAQVATIADLMADSTNEYLSEKVRIAST